MKTRIIYTDIWDDDVFHSLNFDTKSLYLYLLTNPFVGQTRIFKCTDRTLSTYIGLSAGQVKKCKDDLEVAGLAYFRDGWVLLSSDIGYVNSFYSGEKNIKAMKNEFSRIPKGVLDYFDTIFDTSQILTRYNSEVPLNLNNKSKSNTKSKSNEEISKFEGPF